MLSIVLVVLMAGAAAAGLVGPELYRDNVMVTSGWRGNDLVTLVVAAPLLAAALVAARRGSVRGRLVWLGMLDYALYNYAFYLFGAAFNPLFLVYVALFICAAFALMFGLATSDWERVGVPCSRMTARAVSAFLAILVLGLGGFHIAASLSAALTGQVPAIVAATGHPTHVIAALDLSLVVSVSALAAVWLWQGRPWGYAIAAITCVKGAVYMLALSAATFTAARATGGGLEPIWLWGSIGMGCAVSSLALLKPAGQRHHEGR